MDVVFSDSHSFLWCPKMNNNNYVVYSIAMVTSNALQWLSEDPLPLDNIIFL